MCDYHLVLSDGTKVWLNAASTLRYPARFAADSRVVYVTGEVYLEVAKDENRPFYVVTDELEVKVLGTCFNVRSYPGEKTASVTLAEGKVETQIADKSYRLRPGEQLRLEEYFGGVSVVEVNTDEALAWRRGYYVFRKSRLAEVTSTLQHWYGVHIELTGELQRNTRYTGVINKEEPVEVFLKRLKEVAGVSWERNGNTIFIY